MIQAMKHGTGWNWFCLKIRVLYLIGKTDDRVVDLKLGFVNFVGYFCGLRFFCETSEGFCSFQEAESL